MDLVINNQHQGNHVVNITGKDKTLKLEVLDAEKNHVEYYATDGENPVIVGIPLGGCLRARDTDVPSVPNRDKPTVNVGAI